MHVHTTELVLYPGKLPEEAKEAQNSEEQQGPQAWSKQGAESRGEDKSKHKMSEKL